MSVPKLYEIENSNRNKRGISKIKVKTGNGKAYMETLKLKA